MLCILLLLCSYYSHKTEPLFLLWSTKWCACQLNRLLCFLQMMMQCHTCENGKGVRPLCGWLSSALPVTASPWIICTRAPITVHYGCNGKPQPGKIQFLSCGKLRLLLLIQLNTCSGLKPLTEIKIFCCTYIGFQYCFAKFAEFLLSNHTDAYLACFWAPLLLSLSSLIFLLPPLYFQNHIFPIHKILRIHLVQFPPSFLRVMET